MLNETPDEADIYGAALPLEYESDLDPLLARIGGARCVLLGAASHGTHEYYAWRAALTRRLIAEHGFSFVAVEWDWRDCRQIRRSVTGTPEAPQDPRRVLEARRRWPAWVWANEETARFCRWLREHNLAHNSELPPHRRVGFYGLDVYGLWESLHTVHAYLTEHHPDYLGIARNAYRCFDPYGENPQVYAWKSRLVPEGCEAEALELLTGLRRTAGSDAVAEELDVEKNAEAGAARYYRAMLEGGPQAWNLRDAHMADTLDRLLALHGPRARAVVWAHNTHVGDARATAMADSGMVSLGQLVRERHGRDRVAVVGFAGGHGNVIAASHWDGPMETMPVPAPMHGSLEELLMREVELDQALFVFADGPDQPWLTARRGHRAIGVVYDPDRDHRQFVPTTLADRYDALCWFSWTSPLSPLHPQPVRRGEAQTLPA
ncbi:erythromycin esterase family protein [Thermomonospora curvata]|uniref:Erythromycin esterase n=1 Tax=Thermomonospora curvata (strain ATCC 19995 / DSM 43183 / JCM 3096 / KCTC 9072 / NBRC 15933 / NCIMB 10081 / Henssen B9) TaxID=471852 RepID=D1A9K0_THECD|nr:erythromycin esterase family protein [Thermomonospora curvata]ACY98686.1 Erythromycin esterase [Thermomonospora curvata DSM 43183]